MIICIIIIPILFIMTTMTIEIGEVIGIEFEGETSTVKLESISAELGSAL